MIKWICLFACLYTVLGAPTPTPWIAPISTSQPCTFGSYNLSPMTLSSNAASNYQITDADQVYYVNVCANVINGGGQDVCTQPTPSCQRDNTQTGIVGYPLGSLDYQQIAALPSTINNGTGVQITYGGGPANCGTTQARTTILQIACDPNAGQGTISNVVQQPACVYTFTMSSKYACPQTSTPTPIPTPAPGFPFQGLLVGTGVFSSYQFQAEVTVSGAAGTVVMYNSTAKIDCVGNIKNMKLTSPGYYIGEYTIPDWYGSTWCPSAAGIYTSYQLELVSSSQAIWLGGFYGKLKPIISN